MNGIFEMAKLIEAAKWLMALLLALFLAYYRTNAKLQGAVGLLIARAETVYGEVRTGSIKFTWVCDQIYGMIPAPVRLVITRPAVESLVQNTFDAMAAYAKVQLDKLLDSTMPDIERTGDEPCLK